MYRFTYSISYEEKRGKREITHRAEYRTISEHDIEEFIPRAIQFLAYFLEKQKEKDFQGFMLIRDENGLKEYVYD